MTTEIEELRAAVKGRVVGPADAEYDAERTPWHLLTDQRPAAIVHVTGTEDVQAAIRLARRHRLTVGAQPVGHGANQATAAGMILLRTGALNAIDVGENVVRVGAGVRWRELNKALAGTGRTSLSGSSGDTSVVGHTLGGGLSWFGRKYGQAANRVRAIEVVDAGPGVRPRADARTVDARDRRHLPGRPRGRGEAARADPRGSRTTGRRTRRRIGGEGQRDLTGAGGADAGGRAARAADRVQGGRHRCAARADAGRADAGRDDRDPRPGRLARLHDIKRRVDPANVIRGNHPL